MEIPLKSMFEYKWIIVKFSLEQRKIAVLVTISEYFTSMMHIKLLSTELFVHQLVMVINKWNITGPFQYKDRLILNMGIPILVREHLYIETSPRSLWGEFTGQQRASNVQTGFHVITPSWSWQSSNGQMNFMGFEFTRQFDWFTFLPCLPN